MFMHRKGQGCLKEFSTRIGCRPPCTQASATAAEKRGKGSRHHTWHVDNNGNVIPNVTRLNKSTGMSMSQGIRIATAFRDGSHPPEAYQHILNDERGMGYKKEDIINPNTGKPWTANDIEHIKQPDGSYMKVLPEGFRDEGAFLQMVNDVHEELLRYHTQNLPSQDQIGTTSGRTWAERKAGVRSGGVLTETPESRALADEPILDDRLLGRL